MILTGIPGVCCFLDAILVVRATCEEHDGRLERLRQRGVRLRKDKCELGNTRYSTYRTRDWSEEVQAIREAPEPQHVSELRLFGGY